MLYHPRLLHFLRRNLMTVVIFMARRRPRRTEHVYWFATGLNSRLSFSKKVRKGVNFERTDNYTIRSNFYTTSVNPASVIKVRYSKVDNQHRLLCSKLV